MELKKMDLEAVQILIISQKDLYLEEHTQDFLDLLHLEPEPATTTLPKPSEDAKPEPTVDPVPRRTKSDQVTHAGVGRTSSLSAGSRWKRRREEEPWGNQEPDRLRWRQGGKDPDGGELWVTFGSSCRCLLHRPWWSPLPALHPPPKPPSPLLFWT
ncbi:unnamed protein product [Leuciscus chuanchicus]